MMCSKHSYNKQPLIPYMALTPLVFLIKTHCVLCEELNVDGSLHNCSSDII